MRIFHIPARLICLALASFICASAQGGKDLERLERRAAKIGSTITSIQIEESSKIPAQIMKQARGIIILRQYEAGFIFGAKGGFGMAIKRHENGEWGSLAWIKTGEISGGLQIGAQTLNVVLLIMDDEGLKMLDKAKFQIGVDAAVTAGPTGSNATAQIGGDVSLLAYTDTEGLYAGATFEGGFLLPDKKSNAIAYGRAISVPEILAATDLQDPDYGEKIRDLLRRVEAGEDISFAN